jgi:hypothetical protein
MRLTSTGLGIGTSSPAQKLDVAGVGAKISDGTYTGYLGKGSTFASVGGGAASDFAVRSDNALVFATGGPFLRATLDSSGNLGLGVTPSAWGGTGAKGLQVGAALALGYTNATGSFIAGNAYYSSTGWQRVTTGAATAYLLGGDGAHIWYSTSTSSTANSAISFTQAMTLDASGNLLIGGTTTPSGGKANNFVNLGGSGGFWTKSGGVGYFGTFDNYAMVFATNDTERARITSGGDLLVGTTTYGGGANVAGAGLNPVGQIAVERDGGAAGVFNRFSSDGNLVLFRRQGTTVGSIDVTTTATAYVTSSDYRLKNITGLITNSGAYIDSLKPVEGTWKADGSVFVGLIAHEVQESSRTRIATGTKDGEEMQGIDYSASEIIANLIAELQSLRARVAQLEAK